MLAPAQASIPSVYAEGKCAPVVITEPDIPVNTLTRINKYICESGICSRKAADIEVKRGVVFINDKQAVLGDKVSPGDVVTVNGRTVQPLSSEKTIFVVLYKPVGIVCTAAKTDLRNVVDFVDHKSRIYPIGRLDKDSQGLIFLTNRCDLVDKILRAENSHEKEYLVTVDKVITDDFVTALSAGVPVLGTVTKQCRVSKESDHVLKMTLVQGLNRQIRRMCKHHNYTVKRLERIRIMHISSNGLSPGQWRDLTQGELTALYRMLENSTASSA